MSRLACAFLSVFLMLTAQAQVQRAAFSLTKNAAITFEQAPFKAANKSFKYYESKLPNASKSLIAIDGKPVFGTDGEMPQYVLAKATLYLNGHIYYLHTDGMYNPWSKARMGKEFVRLRQKGGTYELQAVFSDGAGSYLAEWQIKGTSAHRSLLTSDDALVTGFFQPAKSSK